jgi:hypothetical protein
MPKDMADFAKKMQELAEKVAAERNADVILYSGPVGEPNDHNMVDQCMKRRRRPNAVLILTTYGGDANAAYRIARCLQHNYTEFSVIVAGFCKSAGTLLLVGAHRLVMLEHAELGPLDVQLRKDDEFGERSSGLTPMQALTVLQERAFNTFSDNFLRLKVDMLMTTRTAAEIATNLATGLYSQIFGQVDPIRLGEMDRAVNIAMRYGERLAKKSGNMKDDGLRRLVADYPSHEFIIDREESKEIFKNVAMPTDAERELVEHIELFTRKPVDGVPGAIVTFLSDEPTPAAEPLPEGTNGQEAAAASTTADGDAQN